MCITAQKMKFSIKDFLSKFCDLFAIAIYHSNHFQDTLTFSDQNLLINVNSRPISVKLVWLI